MRLPELLLIYRMLGCQSIYYTGRFINCLIFFQLKHHFHLSKRLRNPNEVQVFFDSMSKSPL